MQLADQHDNEQNNKTGILLWHDPSGMHRDPDTPGARGTGGAGQVCDYLQTGCGYTGSAATIG